MNLIIRNTSVKLKTLLKRLHGWLYLVFLAAIVQPPGRVYRGGFYTLPRIAIMQFLENWQPRISGKVLDVGIGTWSYPRSLLEGCCEYTATDCFEHPNIDVVSDIHRLSHTFPPETFDFVICTDVLEHIPQPWVAVRELYAVLRPGGTLLLTTPFNFHLHGNQAMKDYWRISADGLRHLLIEEAGFREATVSPVGRAEFPFSHTVVARK